MILLHKAALVKFQYIREFKPQFTNVQFVTLLNLKTGKHESFQKSTYLDYFTIVEN